MPVAAPSLQSTQGSGPQTIMGPNGQPLVQNGQFTPQGANVFAAQAVGGGNPYGPPPTPAEGANAAHTLAANGYQGPAAPAAPAGDGYVAPPFMSPAMQDYVNQFHQSQANMQQALNGSLAQALTGLKGRRDAAAKVVATLPGEYDAAYKQATNSANSAAHAAAGAFHGPTLGGSNGQSDIAAQNAGARAAGKVSTKLMGAGLEADYSKGQTTLQNTHMQNEATLNDENTQFAMQMAHDKAAYDNANAQQRASIDADIAKAHLTSSLGREDATFNANLNVSSEEKLAKWKADHPQYGSGLTPEQQISLQNSQNSGARANHYTSYAGEQNAGALGPNLVGIIQSGMGSDGKPRGDMSPAAKNQVDNAMKQLMTDPDLKQWAGTHGLLTKDPKTGNLVVSTAGYVASNVGG